MARNYLLARQIYFSPTCVVYWFLLFVNVCFYTLLAFTFCICVYVSVLIFHASYAAAFRCFIFYTSYVLFLFFMFVISTVFSLTHPLVLCNTFEYNFYSIFYNILLFQSVIFANYICCKIYNICVVFTVYFSLRDPLLHFFTHQSLPCQTIPHEKPHHAKYRCIKTSSDKTSLRRSTAT